MCVKFLDNAMQADPLNNPPVSLLGYDILNDRPSAEQLKQASCHCCVDCCGLAPPLAAPPVCTLCSSQ